MEANNEMIEGYRDGLDLNCPEPSDNRSHSYRHGFKSGRGDRNHKVAWGSLEQAYKAADLAMQLDAAMKP